MAGKIDTSDSKSLADISVYSRDETVVPEFSDWREVDLENKKLSNSSFLIGTIEDVNNKIGTLEHRFQNYTQLVIEKHSSHTSDKTEPYPSSACSRLQYRQKDWLQNINTSVKCLSMISVNGEQQTTGVKKDKDQVRPKLLMHDQFTGFDPECLTSLPGYTAVEILQIVVDAVVHLNKKSQYKAEFQRLFFSPMSQAILQDMFWYVYLARFQVQPDPTSLRGLFNRTAHNYVKLFFSAGTLFRDTFMKVFPKLMFQSLYAAFCFCFADSYKQFGETFKDDLVYLVFGWMAGIRPPPRCWLNWKLNQVEPAIIRNRQEILQMKPKQKMSFNMEFLVPHASQSQSGPHQRQAKPAQKTSILTNSSVSSIRSSSHSSCSNVGQYDKHQQSWHERKYNYVPCSKKGFQLSSQTSLSRRISALDQSQDLKKRISKKKSRQKPSTRKSQQAVSKKVSMLAANQKSGASSCGSGQASQLSTLTSKESTSACSSAQQAKKSFHGPGTTSPGVTVKKKLSWGQNVLGPIQPSTEGVSTNSSLSQVKTDSLLSTVLEYDKTDGDETVADERLQISSKPRTSENDQNAFGSSQSRPSRYGSGILPAGTESVQNLEPARVQKEGMERWHMNQRMTSEKERTQTKKAPSQHHFEMRDASKENAYKMKSHPACKGPEFLKASFNICGRSPLVAHFLRVSNFAVDLNHLVRVQRTEIDSLPPLDAQTYQDVIKQSSKTVKTIELEFRELFAKCQKEWTTSLHERHEMLREYSKREAALLANRAEMKRLSNLIILEQMKGLGSVSAGARQEVEAALKAQGLS